MHISFFFLRYSPLAVWSLGDLPIFHNLQSLQAHSISPRHQLERGPTKKNLNIFGTLRAKPPFDNLNIYAYCYSFLLYGILVEMMMCWKYGSSHGVRTLCYTLFFVKPVAASMKQGIEGAAAWSLGCLRRSRLLRGGGFILSSRYQLADRGFNVNNSWRISFVSSELCSLWCSIVEK